MEDGTALNLHAKDRQDSHSGQPMIVRSPVTIDAIQKLGLNVGFHGKYTILHFLCKVGQ